MPDFYMALMLRQSQARNGILSELLQCNPPTGAVWQSSAAWEPAELTKTGWLHEVLCAERFRSGSQAKPLAMQLTSGLARHSSAAYEP